MKEQDEIKDLFRDSFDGFEVTPPASVKINIDHQISQIESKGKLKWVFFGVFSALILVLAILFLNKGEIKSLASNLASNGKSQYDDISKGEKFEFKDQTISGISQYGDKTIDTNTGKVENKLNATSKINQSTPYKSNSLKPNITSKKKRSSENSTPNYKTLKLQKTGHQKGKTFVKSHYTVNSKSKTNISNSKNKKTKRNSSNSQNNKIKPDEIKHEIHENPINSGLVSNIDGNETNGVKDEKKEDEKNTTLNLTASTNVDNLNTTLNNSSQENDRMMDVPKVKNPWLFSLKTGTSFGFNKVNAHETFALKEKSSLFIQTEFAYYFNPKMAISSGLNYNNNFENISQDQVIFVDTAIISYNYTYVLDSMQNVIDSIAIPVYGPDSTTINSTNSYQVYAIGLPILFQYTFEINPKLFLDVSTGAILNLQGSRTNYEYLNTANRTVNQLGIKACLRTQLRYQFSNWGVSLNTNFGYDLKPVQTWENIGRKRSYLDLGVGIHYILK